ncbi:MAG: YfhO family protein [Chloroflexi bacterium]|nr:YfhO family protein [Chloroflexota bacterium]
MADDVETFYFPILVATSEALAQGRLVLWTPSMFAGYPLFADGEAGMLYPIHLLLLPWLAPEASLVVLRIIHSVLASAFMYVLLRTLGMGRTGSIAGGMTYAYCGFVAGQIVHTNVYQALVWLPLQLALVERAFRSTGGERWRFAVFAGSAVGVQSLAVHMQVTMMSGATVAAFVVYRVLVGAERGEHRAEGLAARRGSRIRLVFSLLRRCAVGAGILGIAGAVGIGLSAVQLLPLYELGQENWRSRGLAPALAATNSIWPGDVVTLLLPRIYDTAHGGYWGLGIKWETTVYVGVLPLVLALVGLVVGCGYHRFFFGLLAGGSLAVAMGPYAPVDLWRALHELPGFEVLRSPGRFSLPFSLAMAGLAGYGVDWLSRRSRPDIRKATPTVALGTLLVIGLAYGLERADDEVLRLSLNSPALFTRYLDLPDIPTSVDGAPLTAERIGRLAAEGLSVTNPATAWQIALMLASTLALATWFLGRRFHGAASVVTVGLIFVDLSVVGLTFHPLGRIADLRPEIPPLLLPTGDEVFRIYTDPSTDSTEKKLGWAEPNRLLVAGLDEANGYSSIQPNRHIDYIGATEYTGEQMFDLLNARYVVRRNTPESLIDHGSTGFDPEQPLFSGKSGTPGAGGTLLPDGRPVRADEVRVIARLWDAMNLPDETPVARISLEAPDGTTHTLELLAGRDVSDARLDVPGAPAAKHDRAPVAFTYESTDFGGGRPGEHLSFAALSTEAPMTVSRVTIETTAPTGGLEIYGVALTDSETKEVTQARDKREYRLVYQDAKVRIYRNRDALPRAFLVGTGTIVPAGRQALTLISEGPFDPQTTALLEDPIPTGVHIPRSVEGTRFADATDAPGSVHVTSYDGERVVIDVAAERDAILVLTDRYSPGWVARIDGQGAPVLRADYLFRGVVVPAGRHTVTFTYEPVSVKVGAVMTIAAACVIGFTAVLHGLARARKPRNQPRGLTDRRP